MDIQGGLGYQANPGSLDYDHDILVQYVDVNGAHPGTDGDTLDLGFDFEGRSYNLTFDHLYVHHDYVPFFLKGNHDHQNGGGYVFGSGDNVTIQYSFIDHNYSSSANHSEGCSCSEGLTNFTWRYNYTMNIIGTAYVATPSGADYDNGNGNNGPWDRGAFEYVSGTCPMITLSPATLPGGTVGLPYSQTITASGGTGPYTFTVSTGTLPAGLTLSSGGLLSGTPTAPGTSNFTIRATDAHHYTGTRSYSITVSCATITLSPATLPGGTVGTPYSQTITASGGTGPYTFAVSVGTLPAGLTLSSGGLLSGTPTAAGTSNFTVRAIDAHLCTGTRSYSITVVVRVHAGFTALTPCRVLDTRINLNGFGLALQPNVTRDFNVAGVCGIPADSVAISANLTVTNVGGPGELVVFPADVLRPNTSTLSFRTGRTLANNTILSFSKSSATFSVFNNSAATVEFILDVNGFFR